MWKIQHKLLIWLAALGFNILSLTWLISYFTGSDRTHTSIFMLVVGIGAFLLALGLYFLFKEAIITLIALSVATLGLGLKQLITGPDPLQILWAFISLAAIVYLILLVPPIIRNFLNRTEEEK